MTPALLTPLSRHAGTNMPTAPLQRAAAGVARRLFLCNERSRAALSLACIRLCWPSNLGHLFLRRREYLSGGRSPA